MSRRGRRDPVFSRIDCSDFVVEHVQLLNGGPRYSLSPAFSFSVSCEDQEEADRYWYALTANGGE